MRLAKITRIDRPNGTASYRLNAGYHGNGQKIHEMGFMTRDYSGQEYAKKSCCYAAGKAGFSLPPDTMNEAEYDAWIEGAKAGERCLSSGHRKPCSASCHECRKME